MKILKFPIRSIIKSKSKTPSKEVADLKSRLWKILENLDELHATTQSYGRCIEILAREIEALKKKLKSL